MQVFKRATENQRTQSGTSPGVVSAGGTGLASACDCLFLLGPRVRGGVGSEGTGEWGAEEEKEVWGEWGDGHE